MSSSGKLLAGILLLITAAGCSSARRGEPITGPLQYPSPGVANGEKAFQRHCSQCHPGGEAGLGPAINNKPLPAFLMKYQVRRGLGAMPSFDKQVLTGAELDDIIAYIKTLRNRG